MISTKADKREYQEKVLHWDLVGGIEKTGRGHLWVQVGAPKTRGT